MFRIFLKIENKNGKDTYIYQIFSFVDFSDQFSRRKYIKYFSKSNDTFSKIQNCCDFFTLLSPFERKKKKEKREFFCQYYSPSLLDFSCLKTRTIHCDATSRHSFYTNKTSTPRHLYQSCNGDIFHLFLFSKQGKENKTVSP